MLDRGVVQNAFSASVLYFTQVTPAGGSIRRSTIRHHAREERDVGETARRSKEAQRRTAAESSEGAGSLGRQAREAEAEEDRPWNGVDREEANRGTGDGQPLVEWGRLRAVVG